MTQWRPTSSVSISPAPTPLWAVCAASKNRKRVCVMCARALDSNGAIASSVDLAARRRRRARLDSDWLRLAPKGCNLVRDRVARRLSKQRARGDSRRPALRERVRESEKAEAFESARAIPLRAGKVALQRLASRKMDRPPSGDINGSDAREAKRAPSTGAGTWLGAGPERVKPAPARALCQGCSRHWLGARASFGSSLS